MKIRIAFYKNSKTKFGSLIRYQQRRKGIPDRYSIYSHVEIDFGDLSFSSSEIDGGVRFKKIDWKNDNWDFIEIELSKAKYNKIRRFCEKECGNSYGMTGIVFAQVFNLNVKKSGTWFCSEIVTRALQEIHITCTLNSLFTKPAELAMSLEGFYEDYILKD